MAKKFGNKNTKYSTHIEPYGMHITFIKGEDTIKEAIKVGYMPQEWYDSNVEREGVCYYEGFNLWILLYDCANIYTLMHECVHALTHMHRMVGIPLSFETDEVLAYHLQKLVQQAQNRLQLPT